MKRLSALSLFIVIFLTAHTGACKEIHFISQPEDTLAYQTFCWQPGNLYRPLISLDGEWMYRVSEKDSFKKVILPASCDYCGEITFRKKFVITHLNPTRQFFRLVCYGINYKCKIFINQKFIGSHSGGYNSFALDIADGIIQSNQNNVIEIQVDTRLDAKYTLPQLFQPQGVKNVFGIFRSLYLLALPELVIEDLTVNTQLAPDFTRCDLEIKFNLKDRIDDFSTYGTSSESPPRLEYNMELYEKNNNKPLVIEKREIPAIAYVLNREISLRVNLNQPLLWSPNHPMLYTFKIQLLERGQVVDQVETTCGIKQLDIRHGNIYLNGNRLILQGINWCENYGHDGALFDRTQLVRELELVKQLHANAVRVLNFPPHPMVATVCDSLGLFLLQEIPLDGAPVTRFQSNQFLTQCLDYFKEMVQRDQTHVCVFAWGLGRQFLFPNTNLNFLVTECIKSASQFQHHLFLLSDSPPLPVPPVDPKIITGISIFDLKKEVIPEVLMRWKHKSEEQVTIVSSYGSALPQATLPNDNKALFEEYQLSNILDAWRAITNFPEIDGYFLTALSDYYGNYPTMIYNNLTENDLRPFGLTDYSRKKRVAYEAVQSLYLEQKYKYNPALALSDQKPAMFLVVGLGTILVFLLLVNSRRYFRDNLKRIFAHPHGFYVDIRDGRKIPPSHTIFMMLFTVVGWGLVMASLLNFFKSQAAIDHLLTLLLPDKDWKNFISNLCWQPGPAILFFAFVSLILFFLFAIYLKLIAIITGNRCALVQCLTTPFWFGANFILYVPLGLILLRLLQYEKLIVPLILMLGLIFIWFFFRAIKGMRVLFIWTMQRAFIVLFVTLGIFITGILYYYQSHYALIDNVKYYYQVYHQQIWSTIGL